MVEFVETQRAILPALQLLPLIYGPETCKLEHDALLRMNGRHTRYVE